MDKRATKILLACILCTVIVLLLFLVAFRFNRLTCELVHMEPERLRAAQLGAFARAKPTRSHDKSMLMKIAAYLEYNVHQQHQQHQQQQGPSWAPTHRPDRPVAPGAEPAPPLVPVAQQVGPAVPTAAAGAQQQQQQQQHQAQAQVPVAGLAGGRQAAGAGPAQLQNASGARTERAERRFLALELDEIETRKLDEDRYRYTLTFNCSTLNMVLVRQAHRVHVEAMSLELEPASRHESSCELQLPSSGAFLAEAQDGLAHYQCRSLAHYNCYHYSNSARPSNQSASGLLLAELHIVAIEFETITNASERVKHDSFRRRATECELSGAPPAGAS